MATLPSREYLLECFDYNKETDTLTWKKRPAEHFDSAGAYRLFHSSQAGKEIKSTAKIGLGRKQFSRLRIIFKILNGFEPPNQVNQKGRIQFYEKQNFHRAFICIDNKNFSKVFKTKIEAQEWLKEMRVKFEKGYLPIVKHKKVSVDGYHGVQKIGSKFNAKLSFNNSTIQLGRFDTAKEASDAYQLAKKQIENGVFVPPPKKISNTGFKGVEKKGNKFMARYKRKHLGMFDTAEEAHEAYLKAKNHKTFDDGLDILAKLAKQYG